MNRLDPINDYEKSVLANVERFGWHCTSVSPATGKDSPAFAYTVGLHRSHGQPEFIIFGLDGDVAHGILGILARAAEAGSMYPLDVPCSQLIDGYDCAFVPVPRERARDYVFSALWFYAGQDFPLYQVVWPDRNGRYPWNKGAERDPAHPQPVLALGEP